MSFINNLFTSDYSDKARSKKNILVFLEERFFPFSGKNFNFIKKIITKKDLVENNLV